MERKSGRHRSELAAEWFVGGLGWAAIVGVFVAFAYVVIAAPRGQEAEYRELCWQGVEAGNVPRWCRNGDFTEGGTD